MIEWFLKNQNFIWASCKAGFILDLTWLDW